MRLNIISFAVLSLRLLTSGALSILMVSLANCGAHGQDAGSSLPLHGLPGSETRTETVIPPAAPITGTENTRIDPSTIENATSGQSSTITGSTSLKVYPQLDKGLLVTPGAHPVSVPEPLVSLLGAGGRVSAKVESINEPRGKFQGLLISVQNNSDRPLLFDGDAATTKIAGAITACIPLSKLEKLSVLPEQSDSFGKRFVTDLKATTSATVTIGWAQTIRDQKQGSGPVVAATADGTDWTNSGDRTNTSASVNGSSGPETAPRA